MIWFKIFSIKEVTKLKRKLAVPKENWIVVKNTHEPLVGRMVFEKIQGNVKRTNITNITKREKRLFENLLYCKECGNTLTITYRKIMIIGRLIVIDIQEIQKEECVNHILYLMIS